MSSVIVNTNSYTTEVPVIFWNNNTGEKEKEVSINVNSLVNFIAADPEIEEVSLFGVKQLNECLKERIQEVITTEYANHKIEIEVM